MPRSRDVVSFSLPATKTPSIVFCHHAYLVLLLEPDGGLFSQSHCDSRTWKNHFFGIIYFTTFILSSLMASINSKVSYISDSRRSDVFLYARFTYKSDLSNANASMASRFPNPLKLCYQLIKQIKFQRMQHRAIISIKPRSYLLFQLPYALIPLAQKGHRYYHHSFFNLFNNKSSRMDIVCTFVMGTSLQDQSHDQ